MTAAEVEGVWSEEEKEAIWNLLEPRLRRSRKHAAIDPGTQFCHMLTGQGLAEGVWHREGKTHEFVFELTDPNDNRLEEVYEKEVELQGKYPLVSLDFDIRFSPITDEDKKKLKAQGYKFKTPPRSRDARGR
jgi:hypothetical protein